MLPPPLSLPSSASKAALRRRALGSRAPSVAMLDDGSGGGGGGGAAAHSAWRGGAFSTHGSSAAAQCSSDAFARAAAAL